MSTLEKLLVLGVLILVGVILAISLFWNRADNLNNNGDLAHRESQTNPQFPNRSELGNGNNPASFTVGGENQQNAESRAANPSLSIVNGAAPANPANVAPYPFLYPSLNPDLWKYRVRQGDTPMAVSERVSGSRKYAAIISRANEDTPFVPGNEINIPREVVKAPGEIALENVNNTGTAEDALLVTGPKANEKPAPGNVAGNNSGGASNAGNTNNPSTVTPAGSNIKKSAESAPDAKASMYLVKRGDSLRKIAREQLKSEKRWQELRDYNNLKGDAIREGTYLKIPK
jgi:LysM repeat protein